MLLDRLRLILLIRLLPTIGYDYSHSFLSFSLKVGKYIRLCGFQPRYCRPRTIPKTQLALIFNIKICLKDCGYVVERESQK